jgi:hypothetical protein
MKRWIIPVMAAYMLFSISAYAAEETDIYGNQIDWNQQAAGDEDGAGDEKDYDLMDPPAYLPEEQEAILETMPSNQQAWETGSIHIRSELGDQWPGYNISLVLYDSDNRRTECTVYDQNGLEGWFTLPIGEYHLYRVYVPGDEDGERYPLVASENVIVIDEKQQAELQIRSAEVWGTDKQENAETQKETATDDNMDTSQPGRMIKIFLGILGLIVLLVAAYIRLCVIGRSEEKYD